MPENEKRYKGNRRCPIRVILNQYKKLKYITRLKIKPIIRTRTWTKRYSYRWNRYKRWKHQKFLYKCVTDKKMNLLKKQDTGYQYYERQNLHYNGRRLYHVLSFSKPQLLGAIIGNGKIATRIISKTK